MSPLIDDAMVEAVARALHDHWQGDHHAASRPWAETVERLPGQAKDFRVKAHAALEAALPMIGGKLAKEMGVLALGQAAARIRELTRS